MARRSPANPEYDEPRDDGTPVPRVENLFGLFRTQSAVPTGPARKLEEQIRIVSGVVYVYDQENDNWISLAPPAAVAASYPGRVASDGSEVLLPDGWSSVKHTTGSYSVTHGLGHSNFAVAAVCASEHVISITTHGTNAFDVAVADLAGNAADAAFSFVLSLAE